jgi:murein DD-endopeptidase MepM/ murein hydrolase activator NlpD
MTIDATPFDPTSSTPRAPRLSRRSMLAGLGVGGALLTVLRTGESAGAIAGQLNGPGQALASAQRIPPTTTTTTTTTTTVPDGEVDQPSDGQIRFPIIVGEDDTCYVGDNFGACRSGCSRSHEGVDIMADQGLEVIAVVDGTLTKKYVNEEGSCGGAGNGWTLTDGDNDVVYKFFHLDAHAEGLEVGDTVTAGQVIGYIGETGTSGVCSEQFNNYHLHFEYRPGDVARDSFDLLARPEHVNFSS